MADTYEFYSPPVVEHPPSDLSALETATRIYMKSQQVRSRNGLNEVWFRVCDGEVASARADSSDRTWFEAVKASLNGIPLDRVGTVSLLWVTNADCYKKFITSQVSTLSGNWHTDAPARRLDWVTRFYRRRSGRNVIPLFGDGLDVVEGTIRAPMSEVQYYAYAGRDNRSSAMFDDMVSCSGIVVGEHDHFLRGPLDPTELLGDYSIKRLPEATWAYWDPSLVHRPSTDVNTGRAQIFVDYNIDCDPNQ